MYACIFCVILFFVWMDYRPLLARREGCHTRITWQPHPRFSFRASIYFVRMCRFPVAMQPETVVKPYTEIISHPKYFHLFIKDKNVLWLGDEHPRDFIVCVCFFLLHSVILLNRCSLKRPSKVQLRFFGVVSQRQCESNTILTLGRSDLPLNGSSKCVQRRVLSSHIKGLDWEGQQLEAASPRLRGDLARWRRARPASAAASPSVMQALRQNRGVFPRSARTGSGKAGALVHRAT